MVTASFHKFTLLPPELQQQIWTLAAESTARAHFFTYNDEDEESDITRENRFIRRKRPRSVPPAEHLRVCHRPRTTESEYGPYLAFAVPADDDRSVVRTAKQKRNKDDFVLGTYRDKDGVTRNVTVRYQTDLIILRPTELGKLSRDRVKVDCPPYVWSLALEYDPSWPQFGEGPPSSARAKAACERLAWLAAELCYWPKSVWFIDYSLRRRPDAVGWLDKCRQEFWCATGRFVEVWDDDEEDWYTGPADGVHKLVASLKEDPETRLKLEEDLEEMGIFVPGGGIYIPLEPDHPHQIGIHRMKGTLFGVLAFQPW
ncbi:hypothetical protein GE09DRAFT_1272862 [Coniochaeta sp. 2T2.1]|nr:hypothetical protein GE09DRAFT_1272862 [Coniochaeta sp. 2T2.1]